MSTRHRPNSRSNSKLAATIQAILAAKELTLYRVSQRSELLYGRSSPFFIPHNLYCDLREATFSPSIYQLVAFSRISGYRLSDWICAVGADLEDIARLQVLLPSSRTIVLDSSLVDHEAWVPWFCDRSDNADRMPVAPLSQLLRRSGHQRIRSLSPNNHERFIYAKIGRQDALAFPDLLPGSIVRVNTDIPHELTLRTNSAASRRVFLIEHAKGLFCSRLRVVGDHIIAPVTTELSYAQVEFRHPGDAVVRGIVDLELRPLVRTEPAEVPDELAKQWKPRPFTRESKIGQPLRDARAIMQLSLREAAEMSRKIADLLADSRYFTSPSSLCDYELLNTAPRRIHKAITLCALYGLRFQILLASLGIGPEDSGRQPMPDHLIGRLSDTGFGETSGHEADGGFLEQLLERCEEIPFFLRRSIEPFSDLESISLSDLFWIGGEHDVLYPYLQNGLLALLNRKKKRPFYFASKPLWQQPLYVLLKRDGTYLCACCGVENGTLVVHPYSQRFHRSEQFRYHHDVEVVGQIIAIARKL